MVAVSSAGEGQGGTHGGFLQDTHWHQGQCSASVWTQKTRRQKSYSVSLWVSAVKTDGDDNYAFVWPPPLYAVWVEHKFGKSMRLTEDRIYVVRVGWRHTLQAMGALVSQLPELPEVHHHRRPLQPIGGELRQYPQNNVSPIQNISSLCKYLDFTQCKYLISIAAMLFPQLSDVTSILSVCIERETSLFY